MMMTCYTDRVDPCPDFREAFLCVHKGWSASTTHSSRNHGLGQPGRSFWLSTPMQTQNPPINYLIYARKSTESEDRQIASIDSQIKELQTIAERDKLAVVDVLSESQSAKAPGRPVFNTVLTRINRGEAQGILCWKLDRLARNPVDGGNISWMLQQGIIQHIQTHERGYFPTDNVLMMSVELGMANQFIRDLSENTKRGLRAKVEQGWYPGVAKPGYLNEWHREKGERTTPKDPKRFRPIKRAFSLLLTGAYTPAQILDKLNNAWGYRTPIRKKLGGVPLPRSTFYRILTDPFYYGRFEFPQGSGNWYQGKHVPMITEEEFWHIQKLLGRHGRQRPQKRTFAYTGLITCGECAAAITAEAKEQIICSKCKRKFASRNREACPACSIAIAKMKTAKHLYYEYYHCTKRKEPSCSQRSIKVAKLEAQILDILDTISISENLRTWYIEQLETLSEQDTADRTPVIQSLQQAIEDCQKRMQNLLRLKISPQNTNSELLSDKEFADQKQALQREMEALKQKTASAGNNADQWETSCIKTLNFACYAKTHFRKGPTETKRAILSALGSNLTLHNKKLRISLHKHFQFVQHIQNAVQPQNPMFEPKNSRQPKGKNRVLDPVSPTWLPLSDDVRTYFLPAITEKLYIPVLKPCT